MGLRNHADARPISGSPAVRGLSWGHPTQAMLGCGSMPSSWPCWAGCRLLAGAGEVQAPRHPDLLRLFSQPVISIAARVCNYLELSLPGAGAAWEVQGQSKCSNPLAGRQGTPGLEAPLVPSPAPGAASPLEGWKDSVHPKPFQEPLGYGVPAATAQGAVCKSRR